MFHRAVNSRRRSTKDRADPPPGVVVFSKGVIYGNLSQRRKYSMNTRKDKLELAFATNQSSGSACLIHVYSYDTADFLKLQLVSEHLSYYYRCCCCCYCCYCCCCCCCYCCYLPPCNCRHRDCHCD